MQDNPTDLILDHLKDNYNLSEDDINADSLLFTDGYLDSFAAMSLVTFIENSFSVKFETYEVNLENFDSVSNILSFIQQKKGSKKDTPVITSEAKQSH